MSNVLNETVGQNLSNRWITVVSEIGMVVAVAAIILFVGTRWIASGPIGGQMVIWFAYVAMVAMIWAGLRRRGQSWSDLGLGFGKPSAAAVRRAIWQSVVILIGAVAAFAVGSVVGANLFGLPEQADLSRYNPLRGNLPLLLAALPAVWLASSVGEEIVFRGFLIHRMAEIGGDSKAARWMAVAASGVAFGLVHYAWGPTGIVQTTCMGLALGAAFLFVGRNLWVTILTHVYMDTMLLVPLYFAAVPDGG